MNYTICGFLMVSPSFLLAFLSVAPWSVLICFQARRLHKEASSSRNLRMSATCDRLITPFESLSLAVCAFGFDILQCVLSELCICGLRSFWFVVKTWESVESSLRPGKIATSQHQKLQHITSNRMKKTHRNLDDLLNV